MAKTIYIRDADRATMEKNKPASWPLVDYLGYLASLHNDMDELERAQSEYDYQRYLAQKRNGHTATRQAKRDEIDMRFCSPHCRHLTAGTCFCTAVYDVHKANSRLERTADTGQHIRNERCPYTMADFRWWKQGADEDALAMEEE